VRGGGAPWGVLGRLGGDCTRRGLRRPLQRIRAAAARCHRERQARLRATCALPAPVARLPALWCGASQSRTASSPAAHRRLARDIKEFLASIRQHNLARLRKVRRTQAAEAAAAVQAVTDALLDEVEVQALEGQELGAGAAAPVEAGSAAAAAGHVSASGEGGGRADGCGGPSPKRRRQHIALEYEDDSDSQEWRPGGAAHAASPKYTPASAAPPKPPLGKEAAAARAAALAAGAKEGVEPSAAELLSLEWLREAPDDVAHRYLAGIKGEGGRGGGREGGAEGSRGGRAQSAARGRLAAKLNSTRRRARPWQLGWCACLACCPRYAHAPPDPHKQSALPVSALQGWVVRALRASCCWSWARRSSRWTPTWAGSARGEAGRGLDGGWQGCGCGCLFIGVEMVRSQQALRRLLPLAPASFPFPSRSTSTTHLDALKQPPLTASPYTPITGPIPAQPPLLPPHSITSRPPLSRPPPQAGLDPAGCRGGGGGPGRLRARARGARLPALTPAGL
jgi:hypothetical protein